jgi:hypothetical protein
LLKPGLNILAVAADNGSDAPNPAGLIGSLTIQLGGGGVVQLNTDREWQSATTAKSDWTSASTSGDGWEAAMELGPLGMAPWAAMATAPPNVFCDPGVLLDVLAKMGVPPNFETDGNLRYIHRRDGNTDIFFVANGENNWVGANCTFRVPAGRVPEFWDPLTGRIERQAVYQEQNGRITLPIWLEPSGSLFVVFREDGRPSAGSRIDPIASVSRNGQSVLPETTSSLAAPPPAEIHVVQGNALHLLAWQSGRYELKSVAGQRVELNVPDLPAPLEIAGPWELRFAPGWGAPERVALDKLISWSEHNDPGVKYFSGAATYRQEFTIPAAMISKGHRLFLDLGKVQVMAEVKLNGKSVGILWRPPYRVDVSDSAKAGENTIEVKVVNLWPNRMIGDEQLPEDSDRKPDGTLNAWPSWLQEGKPSPTGRYTFTSWRLWKKSDVLLDATYPS